MPVLRAVLLSKSLLLTVLLIFADATVSSKASAQNQNWQLQQQRQMQQQRTIREQQLRAQRERQRQEMQRRQREARLKAQRDRERLDRQRRDITARNDQQMRRQQIINERLRLNYQKRILNQQERARNEKIKQKLRNQLKSRNQRQNNKKQLDKKRVQQTNNLLRQQIFNSNTTQKRINADSRAARALEKARRLAKARQDKQIRNAALTKKCSFHGDTLVLTDAGLIPIRDIYPDIHRIWARDEISGETGWKDILAHYSNHYDETLSLTVLDPDNSEEQVITSNRIHPFFARPVADMAPIMSVSFGADEHEDGEWIEAQHLTIGQRLYAEDGTWDIVSDLKIEQLPLKAFNLTVDDFHTYFIAQSNDDTPLWVHNDCHEKFVAKINKMLPGERVREVREKWKEIAEKQGWTKNNSLTREKGVDIYHNKKKDRYYRVDTAHGEVEIWNKTRKQHLGAMGIDLKKIPGKDRKDRKF